MRPLLWISTNLFLWHVVDEGMIDGVVNGVLARVARKSGGRAARAAIRANTRSYATWVVVLEPWASPCFCSHFSGWRYTRVQTQPSFAHGRLTFLPLLSVAALLVLRADDHLWIRRIALAASIAGVPDFAVSPAGLRRLRSPVISLKKLHQWIGQAIHYHMGVDGISLFLVLLTTFLTPLAVVCSWRSIHENVQGFFISVAGSRDGHPIGVFVSLDLFLFFVFWEVMLIPMYFIIGMWGHERRIYAKRVKFYSPYTMFGSILMLVAILWLYNLTGTFDLQDIQAKLQGRHRFAAAVHANCCCSSAFFFAFAIKVPLFPFQPRWLPDRPHRRLPRPVP